MEGRRWWHPRSTLQRIRQWWRNRTERCLVTIHKPRMIIEGNFLRNQRDSPPIITFRGIPYARPPVGLLRFQPPQPLPQNEEYEYHDGRFKGKPCLQLGFDSTAVGSEDCLYLNVAIPTRPGNSPALLPVIFHIHGGGFVQGCSAFSEPETLVRRNMVFVDLNYRLGIFGFLNMHTENCRGNAGMKDIVMALRWVKDNIIHFGGDPGNVTISGHSAGGSAVNLLMVSPLAEGLFHKAIVMAGGIYCPWGYGGLAKDVKRLFMKHMNQNISAYAMVESLKREDPVYLLHWNQIKEDEFVQLETKKITVFLRPSVECIEEGAFLPRRVEELILNAKPVPTIAGITEREGYMYLRAGNQFEKIVNLVRNRLEFAEFLKQNFRWSDVSTRRLSSHVRGTYFPGLRNMQDKEVLQRFSIFVTDIYHRRFYDSLKIGNQERPESAPLYIYRFDYFTGVVINLPEPKIIDGVPETPIEREAAEHGDDMKFVMGQSWILDAIEERVPETIRPNTRAQALRVICNMCDLWTSFCKTGRPRSELENMEWLHHSQKHPRYLHITDSLRMVNERLFQERWDYLNGICRRATIYRSFESTPETTRRNIQQGGAMRDVRTLFDETMNSLLS